MSEMDFSLIAWIKKDQAERREWELKKAKRRHGEDELYMRQVSELALESWGKLKSREKQMVMNLARWRKEGKNFSDGQRSALTALYYKIYY